MTRCASEYKFLRWSSLDVGRDAATKWQNIIAQWAATIAVNLSEIDISGIYNFICRWHRTSRNESNHFMENACSSRVYLGDHLVNQSLFYLFSHDPVTGAWPDSIAWLVSLTGHWSMSADTKWIPDGQTTSLMHLILRCGCLCLYVLALQSTAINTVTFITRYPDTVHHAWHS